MELKSHTTAFTAACAATLCIAVILGGGTDKWLVTDSIIIVASIPLMIWGLIRLWSIELDAMQAWGVGLALLVIVIQAVQIIPLPPSVWTELPGREAIIRIYSVTNTELPWHPLSMSPSGTLYGLVATLPALALFIGLLTVNSRVFERIIQIILVLSIACALLGVAQAVAGPGSPLRYQLPGDTSITAPVGFFANRNHTAVFLSVAIVLFGWAWAQGNIPLFRTPLLTQTAIVIAVILCGGIVALTLSRAGMGIALIAFLAAAALNIRQTQKLLTPGFIGLLIGILVAIVFFVEFVLLSVIRRFEGGVSSSKIRLDVWQRTSELANQYGPLGSGFGTFPIVYAMQEKGPEVRETFMNQAHNDWVQLVLEGGMLAIALSLAFLFWVGYCTAMRYWEWRAIHVQRSRLVLACAIGVVLCLLHSFVDYPLKTLAFQSVFAVCCAGVCLKPSGNTRRSVS